ncbi:PREDICTED: tudor domain-containing protein 3 [Nicrophorus vespilloides]|uniref:Survival of motor neuron-related-splicing factor 30 n=1 Tax=Nicrophorus vespilloides TaxID=110193 RepID=A0ABM1N8G4_NICVS|nr:PREDICTED: tudor domain-containing protein 3 [Nicrophorus vespilloides]
MSKSKEDSTMEILQDEGWQITAEGLVCVSENVKSTKDIIQNAINTDLKDIGKSVLSPLLGQKQIPKLVVQIQKLRNVSAPKANEDSQAAPRMLKLILTDGHSHCQAIETEQISQLSLNKTAPGTKLLLKNAKISSGYILLTPQNCSVLGGRVEALYEKWEVNKNISNHNRGNTGGDGEGPPPWVNFGKKLMVSNDKNFKSLVNDKDGPKNESSEFESQRQDAIAEATSGAVKKVFGGGTKPIKVIRNLQENSQRDRKVGGRRGRKELLEDEKQMQKPSENVSLFDFLENKLSIDTNDYNTYDNRKKPELTNNANVYNYEAKNGFENKNAYYDNKSSIGFKKNYDPRGVYNKNKYDNRGGAPVKNNFGNAIKSNSDMRNGYGNKNSNDVKGVYGNKFDNKNTYKNRNADLKINNENKPVISNMPEDTKIEHDVVKSNTNMTKLTQNMAKMNVDVNGTFAAKAFRQHLNLGRNNPPESNKWQFKIGDQCMAKYWEDNKYYNATVTGLTQKTCVVQFNDYGNMEEVLHADCIPITDVEQDQTHLNQNKHKYSRREFSGSYKNKF